MTVGAYWPLPWAPVGLVKEATGTVLQPTIDPMAQRGTPFAGPRWRKLLARRSIAFAPLAMISPGESPQTVRTR